MRNLMRHIKTWFQGVDNEGWAPVNSVPFDCGLGEY